MPVNRPPYEAALEWLATQSSDAEAWTFGYTDASGNRATLPMECGIVADLWDRTTDELRRELRDAMAFKAPDVTALSETAQGIGIGSHQPALPEQFYVYHERDALEGLRPETTTKRAEQFKYVPLAPFWHKHFFSPCHALRNIGERWNIARGQGNRALDCVLSETATKYGDDPTKWPRELVHRLFVGGFAERADARRLTGDWIIFAKHDGQHYYLDLATHEEAECPANSERLMQKLMAGSRTEFPFLF
jgi:hypothetical protein